ncbi:Cytosolic Fe-S cluster assembly factor nar1 [Malassezia cuniculi]|uniref:Cytosolic Fe-S cluster assembly factor NAR1 n=1 Tax=Malassezia cuniculi TaxID=948313 RepID=A0AAF0J6P9_9BASI|nr:Cytosolic Fe-S cluster assembly factor nar1 [Malassezia cuniculi]
MAFSGALTLTDLNDYLGPSQACIKPVNAPAYEPTGETEIAIDNGGVYETGGARERTRLETAQISLNDCLACSGCVTSAETVLIGKQSIDQVVEALASSHSQMAFVATISPQSLASLAVRYSRPDGSHKAELPLDVLLRRISRALYAIGFDAVGDTTFARALAIREHVLEFRERKRTGKGAIPMLAGSCPGWVLFAEKTQAELLPFVATSKSPQQVAGLLAKLVVGKTLGRAPGDVYHVTVMPCYDKKLEASRPDNTLDGVPEVDCVLTTGELHDLLWQHNFDPYTDEQAVTSVRATTSAHTELAFPTLIAQPGSSSGGYLFAVMHDVWQQHPDAAIESREIRSSDYTEYTLHVQEGEERRVVFKGAICYGFRNLQNLVRKVQRETGVRGRGGRAGRGLARRVRGGAAAVDDVPYDHVEVMACPGGCVNGGGQMRPPAGQHVEAKADATNAIADTGAAADAAAPAPGAAAAAADDSFGAPQVGWQGTSREWVSLVDRAYWADKTSGINTKALADYAPGTLDLSAVDAELSGRMRTTYHGIQPETNGLAVQW